MRFSKLVEAVYNNHPGTEQYNSIFTQVSELHKNLPNVVIKPSKGLYQLAIYGDAEQKIPAADGLLQTPAASNLREQDFYASFAEFLKTDLDEATEAEALGGSGLKGKWGTPDVVGAYKPQAADLVKFPLEIISSEIKVDTLQPVVAFGQAVAYRLFSHRTYVAMPTTLSGAD